MAYDFSSPYQRNSGFRGGGIAAPISHILDQQVPRTVGVTFSDIAKLPFKLFMSGLSALNAPGNVIRGMAKGIGDDEAEWGTWKSLIPFHTSVFDMEVPHVSGRDLLESWNILPENEPGIDRGDLAGFAADLITDPFMWGPWGGLSAAGKATVQLRKVEGTIKAVREIIDTSTDSVAIAMAKKQLPELEARAGKLMAEGGKMGEVVGKKVTVGKKGIGRLWGGGRGGVETIKSVWDEGVERFVFRPWGMKKGIGRFETQGTFADLAPKFLRGIPKSLSEAPEGARELYTTGQAVRERTKAKVAKVLSKHEAKIRRRYPDLTNEEIMTLVERRPLLDNYKNAVDLVDEFQEYVDELMTQGGEIPGIEKLQRKYRWLVKSTNDIREGYIKFKQGAGIADLNMALDVQVKAMDAEYAVLRMLKDKYGKEIVDDFEIFQQLYDKFQNRNIAFGLKDSVFGNLWQRYSYHTLTREGYKWLRALEKADDPLAKEYWGMARDMGMKASKERVQKGKGVNEVNKWAESKGYKGDTPFMETDPWEAAKKRVDEAASDFWKMDYIDSIFTNFGVTEAKIGERTAYRLADWLADPKNKMVGWKGIKWKKNATADEIHAALKKGGVENRWVDRDVFQDAMAPFKTFNLPDQMKGFMRNFAKLTSLYRGATTALFPAYFNRNIMGNLWNGSVIGPNKSFKSYYESWRLMRKYALGELKGADKKFMDDMVESGIFRANTFSDTQHFFQIEHSAMFEFFNDPLAKLGGDKAKALQAKYPFASQFFPAGYKYGMVFENNARVAMAWYLTKKKGMSVPEAAAEVRKYLFNYEELSAIEKSVLRPLAFFYTFTRKNIPLMIEHVMNPASRMWAATIGQTKEKPDYIPKWVHEAGSFVLKATDQGEGGNGFMTTLDLGLPITEFAQPKILSRLNPLIKAPLELATGIDTYFGKPIKEMNRAGWLSRAFDMMVGGPESTYRDLTGFTSRMDARTGKVYESIDPHLSWLVKYMPGIGRAASIGADPNQSVMETALSFLGARYRNKELSPRAMMFNQMGRVMDKLQAAGRMATGEYYFSPERMDWLARMVASRANARR